jgi:hypothetical protein
MPTMLKLGDVGTQVNPGGAMQAIVPAATHGLPSTIAASGNITSNLIFTDGLQIGAVGVTSSQGGVISVQRYLDDAGLVKQGEPLTANLTGTIAQVLNITDGNPFASFTVNISNSGLSTATLTNLAILLQGK